MMRTVVVAIGVAILAAIGIGGAAPLSSQRVNTQSPAEVIEPIVIERPLPAIANISAKVPDVVPTTAVTSKTAPPVKPSKAASEPTRVVKSTTTAAPELSPADRVLKIAQGEVGKSDKAYAYDTTWCAQFVSFVALKAKIAGFEANDSPAQLHTNAVNDGRIISVPKPGYEAFIQLQAGLNTTPSDGDLLPAESVIVDTYITHVALVEYADGDGLHLIQGNGEPDATKVTRVTYRLDDPRIVDYARLT